MSRNRVVVAAMAVVFAAGFGPHVASSDTSGRFSNRTLRGVYGFSGSGTLLNGTVQAAVVGLNSFNGAGGCRIQGRLNLGGGVHSIQSSSCTYHVGPDGAGSLEVVLTATPPPAVPLPPSFTSDFVIVDNGKQLQFMLSDDLGLTVASGLTVKQVTGQSN
jgi:hypothetical protein